MDPLQGSPWSSPATVEGFARGEPNQVLMQYAAELAGRRRGPRAIDIGCGAGRNAVPLARAGWRVLGVDLSEPMVHAARDRARQDTLDGVLQFALAPMTALPAPTATFDLVIAHGIWNLARSSAEFRAGVREAARVATTGAALFVFTFSRHTLPPHVQPLAGETFVFTEFSGAPQCFLTDTQLMQELADAGFEPDLRVPLTEYNRPRPGQILGGGGPVIYEAAFRKRG
jgi:ubiquinone/menaquinone biosynthesis C-methylase UbiE